MEATRTYSIDVVDARDVDGTPYEACTVAYDNLIGIVIAAQDAIEAALILSQNVDLQRQVDQGKPMDATGWPDGVVATRLAGMRGTLAEMQDQLAVLKRAATFDPKRPLFSDQ